MIPGMKKKQDMKVGVLKSMPLKPPAYGSISKSNSEHPFFNAAGQKIRPAKFEEVWLNGFLIHENEALTGPTRAAPFEDEQALGPLMIQGEHGPVAFKNIQYKVYGEERVGYEDLTIQQYESVGATVPNPDTLSVEYEINSNALSAQVPTERDAVKLLVYTGSLTIPKAGAYLFKVRFMGGGGFLEINKQQVLFKDEVNWPETSVFGQIALESGSVPFRFVYNQAYDDVSGFSIMVEGPAIPWHLLSAPESLEMDWDDEEKPEESIIIQTEDQVVLQRSFFLHKQEKRTHVISVATPNGIHFAYDLLFGSLLSAWEGGFLDVSEMWYDRGEPQLGKPMGAPISIHGDPDFAVLADESMAWPDTIPSETTYKSLGYELQADGLPVFLQEVNNSIIKNRFEVSDDPRLITRHINTDSPNLLWHKLGGGSTVTQLPDGTYALDDKNYFVKIEGLGGAETIIRQIEGAEELLLKIPPGAQHISYNIIW